MSHNTLMNYYQSMFNLTYREKMLSITELENMIPFELNILISLLYHDKELQEERIANQRAAAGLASS